MYIYICSPHSNWFTESMNIYLAGNKSYIFYKYKDNTSKAMKVVLAGTHSEEKRANGNNDFKRKIYVLESFYYIKDWMLPYIKNHWHFMLDSGAFTFMSNKKVFVNWDVYTEKYAKFINDNNIDLFLELDIDNVVGLKEVERLKTKLEKLTNKQCIPVWHKSRGKDYWLKMVKDYNYVAIGGIVTGEIKRNEFKFFNWFLKEAEKENCKVHGLGFTNLEGLKKYPFYSVDSTAWTYGNRGGYLYRFNGKTIKKIEAKGNRRLKAKEAAIHNFKEWVKFQKYAEKNL